MLGTTKHRKSSLSFAELVEDGIREYQRARKLKRFGDAEAEIAQKIAIRSRTLQSWRSTAKTNKYEVLVDFAQVCVEVNPGTLGTEWVSQLLRAADMARYSDQAIGEIFGEVELEQSTLDAASGQQVGGPEIVPVRMHLAVSLPDDWVERSAEKELIDLLLARTESGHPVCRSVIVYGAASIGKTTLVTTVPRDEAIQHAFESVFWVDTAGGEARLVNLHGDVDLKRPPNQRWEDVWQIWVRQAERRLLLIVDDVMAGEALRPWVSGLSEQSLVVVTTQDFDSVQPELLNWMKPGQIRRLGLKGFELHEAQRFVQDRLGRGLTDVEWDSLVEVGEQIGWHPRALRLLATEKEALELWQSTRMALQHNRLSLNPFECVLQVQWDRLENQKREWLQHLSEAMNYQGRFSDRFAAWIWGLSPEEAARRLDQLEGTGWIEKVVGQPLAFGTVDACWRIALVIRNTFLKPGRAVMMDFGGATCRRTRRLRWIGRYMRQIHTPVQFLILTALWQTVWLLPSLVIDTLRPVVRLLAGKGRQHRPRPSKIISFKPNGDLRAHWIQKGLEPIEDLGLFDDYQTWWIMLAFLLCGVFLYPLAPYVPLPVSVLLIAVSFEYAMSQMAKLVWLAYLEGVEAADVRIIVKLARWLGMK